MDMAGRADTAAITTTGASVPGEGAGGMPLISQGGSGQGIPRKKGGITGSTFKLVGIITMLIDHTAAVVLIRELLGGSVRQSPDAFMTLLWVYQIMRFIGRIGVPGFCFLLVEGFQKTRNVGKYAFRLGLFALLSEIPFNLALTSQVMEYEYQNVYFTLFLGLMALWGFRSLEDRKLPFLAGTAACVAGVASVGAYMYSFVGSRTVRGEMALLVVVCLVVTTDLCLVGVRKGFQRASIVGADLVVLGLAMFLADLLQTDYAGMGVLTIAAMYLCRRRKVLAMLAGCLVLTFAVDGSEIFALLALIPAALYNGERGLRMKYVFYLFYPVHLLVLYGIAVLMGLGGIPAV